MQPISAQIAQLTLSERIQLVEDLWDTIAAQPEQLHVGAAQREELDRRLQNYVRTPEANTDWEDLRRRLEESQ